MVTFSIIEELEEKGKKYEIDKYKGNSLWIADDATLVAGSIKDMEHNIEILRNAARKYGLEISEEKSKVIQIRGKEKPKTIGNFEIVKKVKYLGVLVGGYGRDIFKYERESIIEKAQIKVAQIKSYIKKSYDKTTVGKAIWKLQMIPAIMYGKQVVILSKKVIQKL